MVNQENSLDSGDSMKDRYGRVIDYVRISLTDRCNLRCIYCMPEEGIELLKHEDILRYEEIIKLCKAFIKIGITTFKLTGGEPLVRKGVPDFVRELKALPGTKEVTLTTNGILLEKMANELVDSGIDRINVSLDTMDASEFKRLTRFDKIDTVTNGINKIIDLGYEKLKINSVPIQPLNPKDIIKLADLAREKPISVRFIELMPIGEGTEYSGSSSENIMNILEHEYGPAEVFDGKLGNGPANYVKFDGFKGYIGFIEALNSKFCGKCNRIRLSSTGFLKLCLHYDYGVDISELIRTLSVDELAEKLVEIIHNKPKAHKLGQKTEHTENKRMNQIGG